MNLPRVASGSACPAPGIGWARQVPGNGSNAKNNLFSAVNRKWVHISYVLIDLLLISLSGVVAFTFRFTTLTLLGAYLHRNSGATTSVSGVEHFGFLLLYAILIVLLFQSQDLYRTPRERHASEETWEVVRSVGLATVILAAFIFCTNVKIVCCASAARTSSSRRSATRRASGPGSSSSPSATRTDSSTR